MWERLGESRGDSQEPASHRHNGRQDKRKSRHQTGGQRARQMDGELESKGVERRYESKPHWVEGEVVLLCTKHNCYSRFDPV